MLLFITGFLSGCRALEKQEQTEGMTRVSIGCGLIIETWKNEKIKRGGRSEGDRGDKWLDSDSEGGGDRAT